MPFQSELVPECGFFVVMLHLARAEGDDHFSSGVPPT